MNMRSPFIHTYIQDDWKVNDKLTVNLGLRHENNYPISRRATASACSSAAATAARRGRSGSPA